jgi:hypothetical protein
MTQRHPICIAGEPKRQFSHVEVTIHHPQLTENRRTSLAQYLANQVDMKPVVAGRNRRVGCKNALLPHRFHLCV